jgi:hypothetical protein
MVVCLCLCVCVSCLIRGDELEFVRFVAGEDGSPSDSSARWHLEAEAVRHDEIEDHDFVIMYIGRA